MSAGSEVVMSSPAAGMKYRRGSGAEERLAEVTFDPRREPRRRAPRRLMRGARFRQ